MENEPSGQNEPELPPGGALFAIIALPICLAVAWWVARDLYAIVINGEVCRRRCETWSTHPWSMATQVLGLSLLTVIFIGLAWGAVRMLILASRSK